MSGTPDFAELLAGLARAVARGRADRASGHPPELAGEDGAAEWCARALAAGVPARTILEAGLVPGMRRVGERFAAGEAFIPEVVMAARAMKAATALLEGVAGEVVPRRGTFVIGTVAGDVHDIGKNVVGMVLAGEGFRVVDLGVDAGTERFLAAVEGNPGCQVGMSALLTTTMPRMGETTAALCERFPGTRVWVGGAPVTREFAAAIGADGTFPDPYALVRHLAESAR